MGVWFHQDLQVAREVTWKHWIYCGWCSHSVFGSKMLCYAYFVIPLHQAMVRAEVTLWTESMNNWKIDSASGYWTLPNVFILNCLLMFSLFPSYFILRRKIIRLTHSLQYWAPNTNQVMFLELFCGIMTKAYLFTAVFHIVRSSVANSKNKKWTSWIGIFYKLSTRNSVSKTNLYTK